jgi:hypothetical protein
MNRGLLFLALVAPLTGCGQKAYTRTTAVTPAPVVSGPLHHTQANCATPRPSSASRKRRQTAQTQQCPTATPSPKK